jgi:tRNA pseudouridine38-40 synthase
MGEGVYALKVAYDGRGFFGSQVQNGSKVRTVAGELAKVLSKSGFLAPGGKVSFASRTDRGVSAAGNVAVYSGKRPILGKLNHHLPSDLCVWASARAPENFNPRHASWKEYFYFLPDNGQDEDLLRRALGYFTGSHDFVNFSYQEKKTESTIEEASVSRYRGFFLISLRAEKFLRLQARKMVAAAEGVASGRMNLSLLETLLSGKIRKGVETAPPDGLVLSEIDYGERISFSEEKPKARSERFSEKASLARQWAGALSVVAGGLDLPRH